MNEINRYVGARIRSYRKSRGMTLQQLADRIHKSRASVSKYETGEITLDVETLYEISVALGVELYQLTDYRPPKLQQIPHTMLHSIRSPFYTADHLYFYFYDGRFNGLKDGVIYIHKKDEYESTSNANFVITWMSAEGRLHEVRYSGKVIYSDMLIRFSFVNQYNSLEEDLLYIFNPLELRDFTEGLLCGISTTDLLPCAFKCLVTLTPQENNEELRNHLLITTKDLQRWQGLNMMVVDNKV